MARTPSLYYGKKAVCRLFGISIHTLNKLLDDPTFPVKPLRITERIVRFPRMEIDAIVARGGLVPFEK